MLDECAFGKAFAGTVLQVDNHVEAQFVELFYIFDVHGHRCDCGVLSVNVRSADFLHGVDIGVLCGHGEHDHVDLVGGFDTRPEVDVGSVAFHHVAALPLKFAHAHGVVLDAQNLFIAENPRQLRVAGLTHAPHTQDELPCLAQVDGPVFRVDEVGRTRGQALSQMCCRGNRLRVEHSGHDEAQRNRQDE